MSFHDNISRAAETYDQVARSGADFNSQFRIDPDTGAATKIGLWSRIRGTGQSDLSDRVKVVEKIIQDVSSREIHSELHTVMLYESVKQLRELELARAVFKGTWDPNRARDLRGLADQLDAQAYHLRTKIGELQKSLCSEPYVTAGVQQGWLALRYVDQKWQPPEIAEQRFGDKACLVFIRGDEAFIYTKPVRNYLMAVADGGGPPKDAKPIRVNLTTRPFHDALRNAVLERNDALVRGGAILYPDRPPLHNAVSAVVMPNAFDDYSSAWNQLATRAEQLDREATYEPKSIPPGVCLGFSLVRGQSHLGVRYIDPVSLEEKFQPKTVDDEPPEVWFNRFCADYFKRVDQMPDPLQGTVRLSDQRVVDRYGGDLTRYVGSREEIRGTGLIGIKRVGDNVEIYEPKPNGGVTRHVVPNDRLSVAMLITRLEQDLHKAYARKQFRRFITRLENTYKRQSTQFTSVNRIESPPGLYRLKNNDYVLFRDYTSPISLVATLGSRSKHAVQKKIPSFKSAAEEEEAYAFLERWDQGRQAYEERAKALVDGGTVSYLDGAVKMTFTWDAKESALVAQVTLNNRRMKMPMDTLDTLKDISEETLKGMATSLYVVNTFRTTAQNNPKVMIGKERGRLGEVSLYSRRSSGMFVARHLTAKGKIVEAEINPTDLGALDILEAVRSAAAEEEREFWIAIDAMARTFGQTTVSVVPQEPEEGGCVVTVTTPGIGSEKIVVHTLKDIQAAIERHQMAGSRLQTLIGETVAVTIPPAPADVPIQRLRDMARGTDFAPQIDKLIGWIENRSVETGVPGDPVEREQWYSKLETLIRLSMKHLIDHPDPGKQISYIAGMADATNGCGGAWMDQAYIQYVALTAPDQFRRIREPRPRLGTLLNDTKMVVIKRLIDKYLTLGRSNMQLSDPTHIRIYLLQRIGRDVGLPVLGVTDTYAPEFMEGVDVMEDFRKELMQFTVDELIDHVHKSMVENMKKDEISELFGFTILKFIEDMVTEGHPERILVGGKPALSEEDAAKMREAMESETSNPDIDAYDPLTWCPAHFWKNGVITRDAVELLLAQFGFIPPSHERPHLLS